MPDAYGTRPLTWYAETAPDDLWDEACRDEEAMREAADEAVRAYERKRRVAGCFK